MLLSKEAVERVLATRDRDRLLDELRDSSDP